DRIYGRTTAARTARARLLCDLGVTRLVAGLPRSADVLRDHTTRHCRARTFRRSFEAAENGANRRERFINRGGMTRQGEPLRLSGPTPPPPQLTEQDVLRGVVSLQELELAVYLRPV